MAQGGPLDPRQRPQPLRSHPPALQWLSQGCGSAPQPACRYKAGEHVIEEGTRPKTLFNLAKGRVTVEIQRLNEATQLPESVKILTLYPGAVFGEMSFLTGELACASVVAELDCEINQIKARSP